MPAVNVRPARRRSSRGGSTTAATPTAELALLHSMGQRELGLQRTAVRVAARIAAPQRCRADVARLAELRQRRGFPQSPSRHQFGARGKRLHRFAESISMFLCAYGEPQNNAYRLESIPTERVLRRALRGTRPGSAVGRRSSPTIWRRSACASSRSGRSDADARDRRDGHHVHGLHRRSEHRPRVAVRRHSAHDRSNGVGAHRERPDPAPHGAESLHRRSVPRPARVIKDGVVPDDIIATSANFLEACVGGEPAVRRLGQHLRHGSRARPRRHGLRPRGQPARAVRRLVHAREPHGHEAGVPGDVRARRRSCPSTTTPRSCSTCCRRSVPRKVDFRASSC